MKITPVSQFGRAPEQGRIRYGVRQNGIPRSITKLRFTSSDQTALSEIAQLYGGQVKPWQKEQSEVITTVSEVPIILPPNPLGDGPIYELWKGSTCVRRCDGISAWIPIKSHDGADLQEVPCICNEAEALECKPTTRLSVILPEVRFGGVWRLDCKGHYGSQELPSMVRMAEQLQARGLTRAYLGLEKRSREKKNYVVPVIRLQDSVNSIIDQTKALESAEPDPLALPEADEIF